MLGGSTYGIDLDDFDYGDDDDTRALERIDQVSTSLGRAAAHDEDVMQAVLPDLTAGQGRLWSFGRGLALGSDDPRVLWDSLVAQFADTPPARRNTQVLCGYLEGLIRRDAVLANELLDDALTSDALVPWFPELQTGVPVDERGAKRLLQSLTSGMAPLQRFRVLAWGKAADPISGPALKTLLLALASTEPGWDIAIEILYMRLFSDRQDKKAFDPALREARRELLKAFQFQHNPNRDHRFESLIEVCLTGPDGAEGVKTLCQRFKDAVTNRETYAFENEHLLTGMCKAQPFAALDMLFGGGEANQKRGCQLIAEASHHHPNPLDSVPLADLISWCSAEADNRFPVMARAINPFKGSQEQAPVDWSDGALALLEKAPDRIAVLRPFVHRLRPVTWNGSRAVAMQMCLPLLEKLKQYPDAAVVEFAIAEEQRLRDEIEREKQYENRDDRERDERFE